MHLNPAVRDSAPQFNSELRIQIIKHVKHALMMQNGMIDADPLPTSRFVECGSPPIAQDDGLYSPPIFAREQLRGKNPRFVPANSSSLTSVLRLDQLLPPILVTEERDVDLKEEQSVVIDGWSKTTPYIACHI